MIITRAPLRISVGGGGTDMPSYYETNGGTIFSSLAINNYIYICLNQRFIDKLFLRYSVNEEVDSVEEVAHDIFRETLKDINQNLKSIEITSTSDIPGGTGLGSSGSFGVALQLALRSYENMPYSKELLASESTKIEKDILGRPIGLQDQYISSYGSLTEFIVKDDSSVTVNQPQISEEVESIIENNLLLFYADVTRDSTSVLKNDSSEMKKSENKSSFDDIVQKGVDMYTSLLSCDLKNYGEIMHSYWMIKRERQKDFTQNKINEVYDHILQNELAYGGKLVGAGGSGFLLFCTSRPEDLKSKMKDIGMKELKFSIDKEGAKLLEI